MQAKKFQVMLAASEIPTPEQLVFPLFASMKLDGIRSPQVNGIPYSRKMIEIPNLYYRSWAKQYGNQLHGLDGEGIVGLPYGKNVFKRSGTILKQEGEPDFCLYVFEDWESDQVAMNRYQHLKTRLAVEKIPRVQLLEQELVRDIDQLKAKYDKALLDGYEGLILKAPLGKYKNGRSTVLEGTLLKWKEWVDAEAVILGIKQGTTNTNEALKDELGHTKRSSAKAGKVPREIVGSYHVRCLNGEYEGKEFYVSTGSFTEAELIAQWHDRENLTGKIMVFKYQKTASDDLPRFAGIKGFRDIMDMGMVG